MSRRVWGNALIVLGLLALLGAGAMTLSPLGPTPTPTWPALSPVSFAERRPSTATAVLPSETPVAATETLPPTNPPPATLPLATPQTGVPPSSPTPSVTATPPEPTASPTASLAPTATATSPVGATPPAPRLEIPKIGLSAGIVEVSWRAVETNDGVVAEWEVAPPELVGHHADSALPGTPGNAVLSAHGRDGAALARLAELAAGDVVVVYVEEDRPIRYRVVEVVTLPEIAATFEEKLDRAGYLAPTEDQRLTLVTCWPSWAYTHRLIVIARPEGA